jgi:hypothetical protein
VSGLSGGALVTLLDNGGDPLALSSNGSFVFATPLVSGATYLVTVGTQSAGETCTVSGGSGVVNSADVTDVAVSCAVAGSSQLTGIVTSGPGGSGAPIGGAGVALVATGASASTLVSTTSQSNGSFSLSFQCPSASTLVYVVASGGSNANSGGANPYTKLASALGACAGLPASVVVNEITTVAAAYALSGFAPQASATSPVLQGKSPGLDNAFAGAANLVDAVTGLPRPGAAVQNPGAVSQQLNTLGNALAACNQSNNLSSESLACQTLTTCARQNALYSSSSQICSNGTTPLTADTFSAALGMTQNTGLVSIGGLWALAQQSAAFSPVMSAAPPDWTLMLSYAVNNAYQPDQAIDAAGNLWILYQTNPNAQLFQVGPTGAVTTYDVAGSGFSNGNSDALAIDANGNVWIGGTGQVAEFGVVGGQFGEIGGAPFMSGNLTSSLCGGTAQMAFDGAGNLWLADANVCSQNANSNNIVELNSSGTVLSGANGWLLAPTSTSTLIRGLAVDANGSAWALTGLELNELNSAGAQVHTFTSADTGVDWIDLAIASGGTDMWITDIGENSAFLYSASADSVAQKKSGGLLKPQGVAIDGAGHVWIANQGVSGSPTVPPSVTELISNGLPLSPSGGFQSAGSLDGAEAISVDQSGNVWIGDAGATVYELVGAGAPTRNPIVSAVNGGFSP